MAPPLPIPNREVKRISAHDTSQTGTIGHRQIIPLFNKMKPPERVVFYLQWYTVAMSESSGGDERVVSSVKDHIARLQLRFVHKKEMKGNGVNPGRVGIFEGDGLFRGFTYYTQTLNDPPCTIWDSLLSKRKSTEGEVKGMLYSDGTLTWSQGIPSHDALTIATHHQKDNEIAQVALGAYDYIESLRKEEELLDVYCNRGLKAGLTLTEFLKRSLPGHKQRPILRLRAAVPRGENAVLYVPLYEGTLEKFDINSITEFPEKYNVYKRDFPLE